MECYMSAAILPTARILDACSLIAFLRREPGASVVDALLIDADILCFAHAINLCEVYYDMLRTDDAVIARQSIVDLITVGVQVREDIDFAFWQQVGQLKVNPGKLSLADCFALALALRMGGTLVTSDHQEFDRIEALRLCPILFIR